MVIATIPSSYYSHRSLEAATVNGGQMSHFSPDVHRNGIEGGHGGSFGGRRRRGRWLRDHSYITSALVGGEGGQKMPIFAYS